MVKFLIAFFEMIYDSAIISINRNRNILTTEVMQIRSA